MRADRSSAFLQSASSARARTTALGALGSSDCTHSPFCSSMYDEAARLGYRAPRDLRWMHLGPIGKTRTCIAVHGDHVAEVDPPDSVPTPRRYVAHVGHHLDVLGFRKLPQPGAKPLVLPTPDGPLEIFPIRMVAWRRIGEPYAVWKLPAFGGESVAWGKDGGSMTVADILDAARCEDVLYGRAHQIGRPPIWRDAKLLAYGQQALDLERDEPHLTKREIALRVGVDERNLRDYRYWAKRLQGLTLSQALVDADVCESCGEPRRVPPSGADRSVVRFPSRGGDNDDA